MPAKIFLSGYPVSDPRIQGKLMIRNPTALKVFAFEMDEGKGLPTPRYLPETENIKYTVYVNETQLKKANINVDKIKEYRLAIYGNVLFSPRKFPGKIGVVAVKVEILPHKDKSE